MKNLTHLLKTVQKCPEGAIKDALCEIYEILEWFYDWIQETEKP